MSFELHKIGSVSKIGMIHVLIVASTSSFSSRTCQMFMKKLLLLFKAVNFYFLTRFKCLGAIVTITNSCLD